MSIKYYIILQSYDAATGTCDVRNVFARIPELYAYELFPVDSKLSDFINTDFAILFTGYSGGHTWHKCDKQAVFEQYWHDVGAAITASATYSGYLPILYEIERW